MGKMLFEWPMKFAAWTRLVRIVGRYFVNTGVRHVTNVEQFLSMAFA